MLDNPFAENESASPPSPYCGASVPTMKWYVLPATAVNSSAGGVP
jgi:hypothetical protein